MLFEHVTITSDISTVLAGRSIVRIIAGIDEWDVLWSLGCHPREIAGTGHTVPHMAWILDDDTVVLVVDVNSGYGGVGPRRSLEVLRAAGVPATLAERIAYHRFVDVDPRSPVTGTFEKQSPHHSLGAVLLDPTSDRVIVPILKNGGAGRRRPAKVDVAAQIAGYDEIQLPTTMLDRWLYVLEDPVPSWIGAGRDDRAARLFTTREAVQAAGFVTRTDTLQASDDLHGLIIEQGNVQIWIKLMLPMQSDLPRYAHRDTAYEHLQNAGFDPTRYATKDARPRWQRVLRNKVRPIPSYVDFKRELRYDRGGSPEQMR